MRLHSLVLVPVILFLATEAFAGGIARCGAADTTLSGSSASVTEAQFYPHRVGPFLADITARDVEFQWDAQYPGGLSSTVQLALAQFLNMLAFTAGTSPIATDAYNLQAVYDYTHREPYDRVWNATDAADSLAFRVGYPTDFPPFGGINLDRSHVDAYIFHPDHDVGGVDGEYPSQLLTLDEDLDTGHPPVLESVLHGNSIMFRGPKTSAVGDLSPTGWTGSTAFQRIGFNHELQHGLTPLDNGGALGEFFSAVAEAVGGIAFRDSSNEVPYTWPLFAQQPGSEPPFIRAGGQNYQARTAFAAYLAYQFIGANPARTLAGMTDDLLYKFMKLPDQRRLAELKELLTDAECGTCAQKAYLHAPNGAELSPRERLMLIHHNWRVANFVNNTGLAEGQYGYPSFGGFSPAQNQRAWQAFDPYETDDIISLPAVRTVSAQQITRELALSGDRSFRNNTYPMTLVPYAANYWILRAGSDLTSANRDLVVRITPRSCFRCRTPTGSDAGDARIMASAVAYSMPDPGGPEESLLWQTTAAAAYTTAVQSVIADSVSGSLELVVPSFGSTHRVVLVVLTASDGRQDRFAGVLRDQPYLEALPYRLDVGVRTAPFASYNPTNTTDSPVRQDREPTWSPNGEDIAFSVANGPSGTSEIWTRKLDMNAVVQPPAFRLVPGPLKSYAPDWSPRGDWIAYAADASASEGAIRLIGPNGAGSTQLTQLPGRESMPAFQPDGQGLAYLHQAVGSSTRSLRWVSIDGAVDVELAQLGVMTAEPRPRWSPDGTRVLISLPSAGNAIHSVPKSGGSLTMDGSFRYSAANFDLPRNGNRVVFGSAVPIDNFAKWASATPILCTFSPANFPASRLAFVDTAAATRDTAYRFVEPGLLYDHPRISPDGTRILYQAENPVTQGVGVFAAQFTWNHAPKFTLTGDYGIQACVPFQTVLQATDPDGEPVTFEAYQLPSGSQIIAGNTFRWQHPSVGTFHVIFRAKDGSGGVDTRVVRISVIDEGGCGDPLEEGDGGCGACLVAGNSFRASTMSSEGVAPVGPPANSYMNGALPGAWFSQTARLTSGVTVTADATVVNLRARMPGSLALDRAGLVVVDHPEDSFAVTTSAGIALARPEPLTRLCDADGNDWIAPLAGTPGSERVLEVAAGTVLTAELRAADGRAGLVLDCARAGPAVWSGESGVQVHVMRGGVWIEVDHVYPRRSFDLLGARVADTRFVRLRFLQSALVRSVRSFTYSDELIAASMLRDLTPVSSDRSGDARALLDADGVAAALGQGETIALAFPAVARVEGSARSYFLAIRAAYTPPTGAWSSRLHPAGPEMPTRFGLFQNRPNLFAAGTTFRFDLPDRVPVRLELFDPMGRRVTTLVDQTLEPGVHAYEWDGRDANGSALGPGLYLYRMTAGRYRAERRLILLPR